MISAVQGNHDPSRWQQVEALYHAALEHASGERASFLKHVCGGDDPLLREVESLLHQGDPSLLDRLQAREFIEATATQFTSGAQLGPYRIDHLLGAGGMGEVFQAIDTRLGRRVAIKTSKEEFPERFDREARAIAALNHANICQLYDVGPNYLVMELIEGPTLAERISQGRIPPQEVLRIATQIAEALDAAHEKGVIHRDLKPSNVKIRPDGTVKVLDFGLAKSTVPDLDIQNGPTRTGMILGTAAYMPPEQAQGKAVGTGADIWSFGVVLYEMLTGERPFQGETAMEVLASVVRDNPNLERVPASFQRLLRSCLQKDPKERLQAIGDWRLLLEQPASPSHSGWKQWVGGALAGILLAGAGAFSILLFRPKPVPASSMRFQIPVPENSNGFPSLSPDSRKVAFIVGLRIWVHFLDSGQRRDLAATEGIPCWSPDSRFIAFPLEKKLKKMDVASGSQETIADLSYRWGGCAWNRENVLVYGTAPGPGFFKVAASGGTPVQITALDPSREESMHFRPSFLPDGRHFAYMRSSTNPNKSAMYVGSVDAMPTEQSTRPLFATHWAADYTPSADPRFGYLVFVRDGTMMVQPFDNRKIELIGEPSAIAPRVADSAGGTGGFAAFSPSPNALVFREGVVERQLTWYARDGKILGTLGEPGDYQTLALSPDGKRVAASRRIGRVENIWLLDVSSGASTQLTFDSASDRYPVWSPDGSKIVFSSNRRGVYDLYEKPANGAKDDVLLFKSDEQKTAQSWSRDGRFILFTRRDQNTKRGIWVLSLDGGAKATPFLVTPFDEGSARFSPDGHWVAYTSDESGHNEIYVRSFSVNSSGKAIEAGGEWRVSDGFSEDPRWRNDSREIYYRAFPDGSPNAVEISTSDGIRASKPQTLEFFAPRAVQWDIASDGHRFLVAVPKNNGPEEFNVILNWQSELKNLHP